VKHIQRKDGESWEIRNRQHFRISCCDCGLTHDFVVVVPGMKAGKTLEIAAKRNMRATARRRISLKREGK